MIPAAVLRIAPVVNVYSTIVMIFSLTMAAPLIVAWIEDDTALLNYHQAIRITFVAGVLMRVATIHRKRELQARDGFVLGVLVRPELPALPTLPVLVLLPGLAFTDADL